MFNRYDIKTYPDNLKVEDSYTETETKMESTLKSKNAAYANQKKLSDEVFQPEYIFTKEKNNISFSKSKKSNKERKIFKILNKNLKNINYDSDPLNTKISFCPSNYVEEKQFSYYYTNTEEKNEKNNNSPVNQRDYLEQFLHQKSNQLPQRTIKVYQNQFDVEKSDNFNVLSYKPEDYESNYFKTDSNSKIIKIFKKEDESNLFFPSKRAISPQILPFINKTSKKKDQLLSYQTPSLKFQSFFGSFTRPKHIKNNQSKSTSKIKKNQLENFNIDKLIEIGDSCNNKLKSILSFGRKINNIKNKNKNKLFYYSENERIGKKFKLKDIMENGNKRNLFQINKNSSNKREIGENNKNMNENDIKLLKKKIIYHGQIKRKRNNKNSKICNNQSKNANNQNKEIEDINENLCINNVKKELYKKNNIFNINNEIKNSIKYKKINSKINSKARNIFDNKNKGNPIYSQILPNIVLPKKKMDICLNDRQNFSINNFKNMSRILGNNKYITMINKENNKQNELSSKIILTDEDSNINGKNIIQQIKPAKKKEIINQGNSEDNNNKTNLNKNKGFKRMSIQNIKIKNYYGYDERHNLEGPINNHSYYVSVYSRKKVFQKNNSIENMN